MELDPSSFDFHLVSTAFFKTLNLNPLQIANIQGFQYKIIQKIIKIEKIWNPTIFDKFKGELKRMFIKYPTWKVWDMV